MWKNIFGSGRPRVTIWRMPTAYWIPKATDTHSKYAIFIAFPLQKWLHERDSIYVIRTLLVLFARYLSLLQKNPSPD